MPENFDLVLKHNQTIHISGQNAGWSHWDERSLAMLGQGSRDTFDNYARKLDLARVLVRSEAR